MLHGKCTFVEIIMKRLLLLLIIILCMSSCKPTTPAVKEEVSLKPIPAPQQQSVPDKPPVPMHVVPKEPLPVPVQTIEQLDEKEEKKSETQESKLLSDVSISTTSFNPKKDEEVAIYYTLSKRAEVEVLQTLLFLSASGSYSRHPYQK